MPLKTLWAPWRMEYIAAPQQKGDSSCLFCRVAAEGEAKASRNLVVELLPGALIMMNRYPYTSGHLMVAPRRHARSLAHFNADEVRDLFLAVKRAEELLACCLRWEGLNIGVNVGEAAGAGIAGHLHVHLVPRWGGDTNFMTVLGETRVIPEHILKTYRKLRAAARK